MKPAKNQKGIAHIPLIIIVLLGITALGSFYYGKYKGASEKTSPEESARNKEIESTFEDEAFKEKLSVEESTVEKPIIKEEQDEKEEEEQPKEEETQTGITLTSSTKDDGVHLYWSVSSISVSKGFKIVKSADSHPTFPDDGYIYVSDSAVRNYFLGLKDGKTWHIRVCRYDGSGNCDYYSNEIVFKAQDLGSGDGDVDKIKVSVSKKSDSKVKLEWSVEGKSDQGFKVVWSKNSGPTYPCRDGDHYHYLSESSARSDYVDDLDDNKTYYFRVCEYLGGKCGTYSNEVSIKL